MKYLVVIEKSGTGYAAYVPDLPGCISTSDTYEGIQSMIAEAIEGHLAVMHEHGEEIPKPTSQAAIVEVQAA